MRFVFIVLFIGICAQLDAQLPAVNLFVYRGIPTTFQTDHSLKKISISCADSSTTIEKMDRGFTVRTFCPEPTLDIHLNGPRKKDFQVIRLSTFTIPKPTIAFDNEVFSSSTKEVSLISSETSIPTVHFTVTHLQLTFPEIARSFQTTSANLTSEMIEVLENSKVGTIVWIQLDALGEDGIIRQLETSETL